jgi:hypothetical protein
MHGHGSPGIGKNQEAAKQARCPLTDACHFDNLRSGPAGMHACHRSQDCKPFGLTLPFPLVVSPTRCEVKRRAFITLLADAAY